jgi:hypothetical protein
VAQRSAVLGAEGDAALGPDGGEEAQAFGLDPAVELRAGGGQGVEGGFGSGDRLA